jgi:teichuronic acid exporter
MSLKKSAVKGVFWNVSANGFNQLINFFVYMLLAYLLEIEEFGLVAFAFLVIEFSTLFSTLGINQNIIQREKWNEQFASSAFFLTSAVSILLTLILICIVAPLIYHFYSSDAAYLIIGLSVLPIITSFRLIPIAKLQRDFQNKTIAGVESVAILIGGLFSVYFALNGYQAWALVIGRVIQSFIDVILIWYISPFRPQFCLKREHTREITSFGLPLIYMSLLTFFSSKAMNIVIGIFLGPVSFAFFTLARRPFMVLLNLSMQQLNKITFATLSRVSDEEVAATYYRIIEITAFIVIPIYMGFGAVSETFINTFLGEKWQSSASLMYLLSLQAPMFVFYWYLPALLVSRAATKSALKVNVIVCLSNIVFATGGAYFGEEGVIISILIANLVSLPLRYKIVEEHVNISLLESIKTVFPFAFAGTLMFFTVLWLSSAHVIDLKYVFFELVLLILIGAVIYFALLFIFFRTKTIKLVREVKKLRS